ncbi:hypothetical protein G7Y89_g9380 [Cudoniella acicularis]|uniref:Uncharacterized protein n=1 Tax=Cudoniella acicularis TaxID=354080 RepID=A0A8H4VZP4_9HELO|nr:hypothetical protein G7Y89_g9380 [Cudoniella acicularis]
MKRINARQILDLIRLWEEAEPEVSRPSRGEYSSTSPKLSSNKTISSIIALLADILSLPAGLAERMIGGVQMLSWSSIVNSSAVAIQFLSLALLSYTRAHSGLLRPFFLDTAQNELVLLGFEDKLTPKHLIEIPRVECRFLNMSCMGQMAGQPVLVFRFLEAQEPWDTDPLGCYNLAACAEDLIDTGGPGRLLVSRNDLSRVFAVCISDGYIVGAKNEGIMTYHRTRGSRLPKKSCTTSFHRSEKIRIGVRVVENTARTAVPQKQLQNAVAFLKELGIFPSYWKVSEKQAGIQAGDYVILQFNQTWVKILGVTKKTKTLSQRALCVADLDSPFGVQVTICTGIAKRPLLREAMADTLPTYISSLITKPRL